MDEGSNVASLIAIENMELRNNIDNLQMKSAQAYQVIGVLADAAGVFDTPEVIKALDYFSRGEFDEDFLPWKGPDFLLRSNALSR